MCSGEVRDMGVAPLGHVMRPAFLLRSAPAGAGLAVAVVYAGTPPDAYGWYTGARERTFPTAFFALRDGPVLTHSMGEDLHGAWLRHEPAHVPRRVHSPLADANAQELLRLHATFAA